MTVPGLRYAAYGLTLESQIPLSFPPATAGGPADVTIRIGRVADTPAAPVGGRPWSADADTFRLEVDGVARYLVKSGHDIAVEPTAGTEADVRVFLLGSVLGACLQQRGILTLHASAVETARGAVLFAGPSGAGKSTLAAALVDRGFRMLSDDVTGVVLDAGRQPVALPAAPAVRLWPDMLETLAWTDRVTAPCGPGSRSPLRPSGFSAPSRSRSTPSICFAATTGGRSSSSPFRGRRPSGRCSPTPIGGGSFAGPRGAGSTSAPSPHSRGRRP